MGTVLVQPHLSDTLIAALIPNDYLTNFEFWETIATENFVEFSFEKKKKKTTCQSFSFLFFASEKKKKKRSGRSLLHLVFNQSLANVLPRLTLLHKFMPQKSWQELLVTTDMVIMYWIFFFVECFSVFLSLHCIALCFSQYSKTPLMEALLCSVEMDEHIIAFLIPSNGGDDNFWKMETNVFFFFFYLVSFDRQSGIDIRGCNMIHLSVLNKRNNTLNNLKTLQQFMPEKLWAELLNKKNKSLVWCYAKKNVMSDSHNKKTLFITTKFIQCDMYHMRVQRYVRLLLRQRKCRKLSIFKNRIAYALAFWLPTNIFIFKQYLQQGKKEMNEMVQRRNKMKN
ncbi:hypothetical protein RFI_10615 [Reticulomyxa filosa]|uniref:Uncharacterized protein n=1 Tax=Reticulomyxa filosa TaxID=46433 RepID=X6NKK5_RETFI|nr:hypothetical protein RFI_10615 [Reticulomyxa filosa]|eukprot:ETO26521.1 hypothetical protein RFI_10615 [Reticulomyxa filosa]